MEKEMRMTLEQLQNVYRYRANKSLYLGVTIEQMEATKEPYENETFGEYYDRHKGILDLYEEATDGT